MSHFDDSNLFLIVKYEFVPFDDILLQVLSLENEFLDAQIQLLTLLRLRPAQITQPHEFSAHQHQLILQFAYNLISLCVDLDITESFRQELSLPFQVAVDLLRSVVFILQRLVLEVQLFVLLILF